MDNPGDYYDRKREEAEAIQQELSRHRFDECLGDPFCKTCKKLERELEQARYVGD